MNITMETKVANTLHDLTGAPTRIINLKDTDHNQLWNYLVHACQKQFPICCTFLEHGDTN